MSGSDLVRTGNGDSLPETTGLAPAPQRATPMPFIPENLDQVWRLSQTLAGSSIIPKALIGKPGDVFVVLVTGHEFGLSPMQSLRGLHVIDGKPGMAADLAVALVLKRKDICKYFRLVESTAERASYATWRIGDPQEISMSFTLGEAQLAGLPDKGKDDYAKANNNWRRFPTAMLRARCSIALARAVYPDIVQGVLENDELDEVKDRLARESRTVAPPIPTSAHLRTWTTKPAASPSSSPTSPGTPTAEAAPTSSAPASPDATPAHPELPGSGTTVAAGDAPTQVPSPVSGASVQSETPPAPEGTLVLDPIDAIGAAIAKAATIKALNALVRDIDALGNPYRAEMLEAWNARVQSVKGAK